MLTADLVQARVKDGELLLRRLDGKRRARAEELAAATLAVARAHVGATRDEVHAAWAICGGAASERKLVQGLAKLIEDEATFAEKGDTDPVALRRDVFLRAAAARAGVDSAGGGEFDRGAVLAAVAAERGVQPASIDAELYADLRGAQPLLTVSAETPAQLVERYERSSVQAVLLRAVRIVAELRCGPAAARAIFHKLKFHRLLFTIEQRGDGGFRVTIDGPFSLFDAGTKYGLELALVLPVLETAERLELEAAIQWGKQRRALTFRHSGSVVAASTAPVATTLTVEGEAILAAFGALSTRWGGEPAHQVLDLPGVGLVVPDLVFRHPDLGEPVYLEVLGYWSRAAVWRRIELVEAGLPHRVLFAVSSRLRVSEDAMPERDSAALYVFKGVPNARAIERKLEALRLR